VIGTVNEAGDLGAPAGLMYLAFQAHGMSLRTFNAIMDALVEAGRVKKRGDVFYPVELKAEGGPPENYS
jgi:hypothetical protein